MLLACKGRMSFMSTPMRSKLSLSLTRLSTERLTWKSSRRIRKVSLTSNQYLKIGADLHEMRDRLCTHVHSVTFNHLWNRHWKALRSRYFPRALHSGSDCDQG